MPAYCLTDVGRIRDHNEDCFGEDPARGLWVVADGMGGHAAGEVASDLAVSSILRLVAEGYAPRDAIAEAHNLVRRAPADGAGTPGMGTTVVLAQLSGSTYRVCWVGDSRAYVHGADGLTQVTRDHSYVQHLVDSGVITPDEADVHPERSVVTQCLGADALPSLDIGEVVGELYAGDTLLLCSDGLTSEVRDAEVASVLGEAASVEAKVHGLVERANRNGGADNITVALIAAPEDAGSRPAHGGTREIRAVGTGLRDRRRRRAGRWLVAASVVAAIGAGGWLGRGLIPGFDGDPNVGGSPGALVSPEVLRESMQALEDSTAESDLSQESERPARGADPEDMNETGHPADLLRGNAKVSETDLSATSAPHAPPTDPGRHKHGNGAGSARSGNEENKHAKTRDQGP